MQEAQEKIRRLKKRLKRSHQAEVELQENIEDLEDEIERMRQVAEAKAEAVRRLREKANTQLFQMLRLLQASCQIQL